jgi:carbon storage regulator
MLLLTRNTHQSVLIHTLDGIIEVTVTQIKNGQVKLGIEAPHDVLIMRKEINDSDAYEN